MSSFAFYCIHSCGCCCYLHPHLHILSGYIKLWRQFPFICVTTWAGVFCPLFCLVSERTQTIHRVQISSQHRNRAFLRSQPITRDVNNSIHSKRDDGQEQENIFFFSRCSFFLLQLPPIVPTPSHSFHSISIEFWDTKWRKYLYLLYNNLSVSLSCEQQENFYL